MGTCQSGGFRRIPEPVFVAVLGKPGSRDVCDAFTARTDDALGRGVAASCHPRLEPTLTGWVSSVSELKKLAAVKPVEVLLLEHSFRQAASLPWRKRPRFLALVDTATEKEAAAELASLCDFVMVRPVRFELLRARVVELALLDLDEPGAVIRRLPPGRPRLMPESHESASSQVSELLKALGVPPALKGFAYLADGVWLVARDPSFLRNLTKRLYPFLARKHQTTVPRVERDIRHAIDTAWVRGNLSLLYGLFGTTVPKDKGKPTNAAFLARLAEEIRTRAEKRHD